MSKGSKKSNPYWWLIAADKKKVFADISFLCKTIQVEMERKLSIGLFGLGTVGSGVVEILDRDAEDLYLKHGLRANVKKILVKDKNKERDVSVDSDLLTTDPKDILQDPEIDTVIEVIGGVHPAKEIITEALKSGKNIITANKAVLAHYGTELFELADRRKCYFGFRAAVTGYHSLIGSLVSSVTIRNIAGVFNGTCNYILTEMERTRQSMSTVLKQAQQEGYAEQDPTLDIDGTDTADKLALLCILAFGRSVTRSDIHCEGIEAIEIDDIEFADKMGYRIKLLALASSEEVLITAAVCPCLVPKKSKLAQLEGVENGILIDDELSGQVALDALGAGKYPTGKAILWDILSVAAKKPPYFPHKINKPRFKEISTIENQFYFRVKVENRPGVLEMIAKVFRENAINIRSVLQQEEQVDAGTVPIVIITDKSSEANVYNAKKMLEELSVVSGQALLLRVAKALWG
jgi:homoserine dehydrogenase